MEEEKEKSEFELAREQYLEQIKDILDEGGELSPEQVIFLGSIDSQTSEDLPPSLHVPKPKPPRTPAQIEQSMANIKKINEQNLQSGPKTEKGKRIASQNAIKLGIHAQHIMNMIRPCYKTCPEYPCVLVLEGATEPGSYCLEKHRFTTSLDAIHDAMISGKHKAFKEMMVVEIWEIRLIIDHEAPSFLGRINQSIRAGDM